MRIFLSAGALLYAYGWQSWQMAVLNVGFIWLGYFIACKFDPGISSMHANGRRPKLFEIVSLAGSYAVAFAIMLAMSLLLTAFDLTTSVLQASRSEPCSQRLYSGCHEVVLLDTLTPLLTAIVAIIPIAWQWRRKRSLPVGPAPRWPIVASIAGGVIGGVALTAWWKTALLVFERPSELSAWLATLGLHAEMLLVGISLWLQAFRAGDDSRLDAAQVYRWGVYGLVDGSVFGVMLLVIMIPLNIAQNGGWIMAIPLLFMIPVVYPLRRCKPHNAIVAVGAHFVLTIGASLLLALPAGMLRNDDLSLFLALIALPVFPIICAGFYWLVQMQKTWLSRPIRTRWPLAGQARSGVAG